MGRRFESCRAQIFFRPLVSIRRSPSVVDTRVPKPSTMKTHPGIELANITDVGCLRERNEDSFAYWEPESDSEFLKRGRLAVVADGMGGYEGGQQASQIAIATVCAVYQ